jgi:hypothetical protein
MRAWLPVVLTVPFALTGCPALFSDWTISGSGAVDASVDATGPEAVGGSSGSGSGGSGASSGSSGGSSSGGSSGSTGGSGGSSAGGSLSGGSGASSSGGSSGGVSGSGGSSTSGGALGSSGGSSSTGGSSGSGGALGSGGAVVIPCNGAGLSTHHTGLGQTWTDCTPTGTYTNAEVLKACDVWCAAKSCAGCFGGSIACNGGIEAFVLGQVDATTGALMGWSQMAPNAGNVVSIPSSQSSCPTVGTWN